jgi:hypothetical protein
VASFSKEYQQKVKAFFKRRFNRDLTDKELLECCQSFSSMGKAIVRSVALQNDTSQK